MTTLKRSSRSSISFIATKQHRRFVEFADAVRREGYIGLCYGPAGLGKTLSARRHAHWDTTGPFIERWGPREDSDAKIRAQMYRTRTVFYTPGTITNVGQINRDLTQLFKRVDISIDEHVHRDTLHMPPGRMPDYVNLLIIDEADRLTRTGLEHLRDRFDRRDMGLLLIGMPGIEKRLSLYPQLYSRIGFAHQYHPLDDDELAFVLTRHWKRLGLTLDLTDFTDAQAVATIGRITRGNFRILHRLFAQIDRIMRINELTVLTNDVIETARDTLVIGDT